MFSINPIKSINVYADKLNYEFNKNYFHLWLTVHSTSMTNAEKLLDTLKVAATDMRYVARSKLSRSLVHKKNFSFIWKVVFKLGYLFCQWR